PAPPPPSTPSLHDALPISSLDSVLVGYSPAAVVPGLTSFAADRRPSILEANMAHLSFDLMVALGSAGALLALWYFGVLIRGRRLDRKSTRLNSSHRTISYA